MDFRRWYDNIAKPGWTPSPGAIGVIWTILYPIIFVTFGFVFYRAFRGGLPWLIALPFIINLVANLLFMPVFGVLKNLPLATLDILIVLATTIWMISAIWPHYRWVAFVQLPYLIWVSIATVLQVAIMVRNG